MKVPTRKRKEGKHWKRRYAEDEHQIEMLNIQKSASDHTGLGYGISSSNTASTSTTVFIPLAKNTEIENIDVKISQASENLDKGKSILGAPPKLDKKEAKNPKTKNANSEKPKQKKQHFCHHCGAAGHTRPNCYKWLVIQLATA